jgi:hypothetical protein
MINIYYVYQHRKKDTNEVFYVGKGKKNRYLTESNRNKYWHNVVNKHDFVYEILFTNLDEELALLIETELIDQYKKIGIKLCNLTNGGEGASGLKHSQETRQKISNSNLGKIITKDCRDKISKALLGIKRQPFSEEHKTKLSKASKKQTYKPQSEEAKKRISTANLGKKRTPEQKLKISEATKLYWQKRKGLNYECF